MYPILSMLQLLYYSEILHHHNLIVVYMLLKGNNCIKKKLPISRHMLSQRLEQYACISWLQPTCKENGYIMYHKSMSATLNTGLSLTQKPIYNMYNSFTVSANPTCACTCTCSTCMCMHKSQTKRKSNLYRAVLYHTVATDSVTPIHQCHSVIIQE